MSKIQSFILDDPSSTVFRTEDPFDTRVFLSLTMYDLRVLAQMIALASFPERFAGEMGTAAVQNMATRVGALMLDFLTEIWDGLTPAEQELGVMHITGRPDGTE